MKFFKYIFVSLLVVLLCATSTYAAYCDELGPDDDRTGCIDRPTPPPTPPTMSKYCESFLGPDNTLPPACEANPLYDPNTSTTSSSGTTGGPRTVTDPKESVCRQLYFLSDGWYMAGCASVKTGVTYTLVSGYCADHAKDSISDPHWLRLGCDGIVRPTTVQTTTPASGMTTGGSFSTLPLNSSQQATTLSNTGGTSQSSSSALAQCSAIRFASLLDIMIWVKCVIVIAVIPLIFTLAFVIFLWGVLRFMYASDSKDKEAAKGFIWWGLVGLFVMVSVWGIIRILGTTLGIDSTVPLLQTSALDPKKATK